MYSSVSKLKRSDPGGDSTAPPDRAIALAACRYIRASGMVSFFFIRCDLTIYDRQRGRSFTYFWKSASIRSKRARGTILGHLRVSQRSLAFRICPRHVLHAHGLGSDASDDLKIRFEFDEISLTPQKAIHTAVHTVFTGRY